MSSPSDVVSFLAEAGAALAASLDYDKTLAVVARLVVPTLGDLCVIDVVDAGVIRRLAFAHVVPEKAELLAEVCRRFPPTLDSAQPAGAVLRSGAPLLVAVVDATTLETRVVDQDHADLLRRLGVRSLIAVPLIARGETIGAISLSITESDRRYDQHDLSLATDLAARAALAVDHARLYRAATDELAQRKAAEEALRISEERFRGVIEQSPLSTQVFDATGKTIVINRAWEELWGTNLEGLAGYNVLADPELERHGVASYLRRAFDGEIVEVPAIRYDPENSIPDQSKHADPVRWVRGFAYPIKDRSGTVREVVLMHEDVTARRRAEEQLRTSEERLRMALESARINVWDWDLATDVVTCSENAREFWGIDVGRAADFLAVVHPDDLARLNEVGRASIASDAPYTIEYRLVDTQHRVRWVLSRARVERRADGSASRIIGVTVDTTELVLAEQATRMLADAGATLGASLDARATLQNLAGVLVPRLADWCTIDLLDAGGELERVAVSHADPARVPAALELSAHYPPRRDATHGPWHVIQHGEPELLSEITDAMLRADAHDARHLSLLQELGLRSLIRVPLTARGVTIGALTLVHAESGRRYTPHEVELAMDLARRAATAVDNARLYERLREEDRRKDEFLATLAHELRNPLAPLRSGLEVLRLTPPGASTERARIVMERQVAHMVHLIDDLLDLSRVTRGTIKLDLEVLALDDVLTAARELSAPLMEAGGLTLEVATAPTAISFRGDRVRMAQILSNLLNNAAKATPRGGRVRIEAAAEDGELVIRVRDTGIGIPRHLLEQVFEMFAQVERSGGRSQGGLGIGLTLVRRLVELHGGRVWAESEGPDTGSTFVVRMPLLAATPAQVEATSPAERAAPSRRVLLVDDNADALELLALVLESEGHVVRTAASGPEALTVVDSFQPEVAFLDIGLPEMDGYELARRLRARPELAQTTLVALTGWGQAEDRRQSHEAGFDHHLTKPVDPADVQALLRTP